jgi:hypothetical protein
MIVETLTSQLRIGREQIERWFTQNSQNNRPTFAQNLLRKTAGAGITSAELAELKQIFERQLLEQVIDWQSTIVYAIAYKEKQ